MFRVWANGSRDQGSIPGQVIRNTQKLVLPSLILSIIRYSSGVSGETKEISIMLPYMYIFKREPSGRSRQWLANVQHIYQHHHHVVQVHPISAESCCTEVWAGRSSFARPSKGVHMSTLLMSSSLFLQLYPAYPVRLILTVLVMGGVKPHSCCFVGCCLQEFFNIAYSILV